MFYLPKDERYIQATHEKNKIGKQKLTPHHVLECYNKKQFTKDNTN